MINISYNISKSSPKCIDLFSGAGGLSLGFLMAGGQPVAGIDNDKDSIDTYKRIFPMSETFNGDITTWEPNQKQKDIDVIIGGPPCQGFSLARGLRFVDDPRNSLYKEFVRIVKSCKPKWVVMENVQGITNLGKGVVLKQILEDFKNIGYQIDYKVINMAEFGVPQLRKRAIFVGNCLGINFEWPTPTHQKKTSQKNLFAPQLPSYVAVNDALGDLALPVGNYFSHRANSKMRGPRNRDAHSAPAFTLRVRGDEFGLCELPAESAFVPGPEPECEIRYFQVQNEIQKYFRHTQPNWVRNGESLKTSNASKVMLKGTRKLTIRESARLQSFPDWINFSGSKYSQSRQIGNAVPPLYAYHLFSQIFKYL